MNAKLKCFLYLLMRDELPCGVVARIVQEISKSGKKIFIYSNKGLAEYADEVTRELIEEKELDKECKRWR